MKYMRWSDLEPGDVLQFTDEYLHSIDYNYLNLGYMTIRYIDFLKNYMTVFSQIKTLLPLSMMEPVSL